MFPFGEAGGQGGSELVGRLEVPIVGDLPASDPPHAFDRIEFWGIRWQEEAYQPVTVLEEEVLQRSCPVPCGVVQDEVEPAMGALEKMTEEMAKGFGVEDGSLFGQKAPRLQVECPEVADLLTGGGREDTRLLSLGSPHSYQAAVSLEVNFVLAPELHRGVLHPLVEVFLNTSCWRGSAS